MGAPHKEEIFLFFLTDTSSGKSYFVEHPSGLVKSTNTPTPLDRAPDGWFNQEVSFGRSQKYHGLNRTYTEALKFYDDAAKIIRYHLYKGKGIEAPLSHIVLKWDDETDIYELYYKGELDLAKVEDNCAESIQVNVMEGGIVKLLKDRENTTYEIPCDGSIPENFKVTLDGMEFNDTFTYQVNTFDLTQASAISTAFIYNVGDNIGIEKGDQQFDQYTTTFLDYVNGPGSGNYLFSSLGAVSLAVKGTVKLQVDLTRPNLTNSLLCFYTSLGNQYNLINEVINPGGTTKEVTFNITINLAAGERLYLLFYPDPTLGTNVFTIWESQFTLAFISQLAPTYAWCISAYDAFVYLVNKIGDGKYQAQSNLLQQWKNLALTCGFALRGDAGAVIKTSMSDFFQSFNSVLGAALGNYKDVSGNDVLFFEKKGYVYNSSSVTMDIGEVAELKISIAQDYFFNLLKSGYPKQEYDEKSGQLEYNNTYQWKPPITRIQKEFDLVSKYRADSYGIEFTRQLFGGKSQTNNSSDNSVFILNIDDANPVLQFYKPIRSNPVTYFTGIDPVQFESTSGAITDFTPNSDNSLFTYHGVAQNVKIDYVGIVVKGDGTQHGLRLVKNGVTISQITLNSGSTLGAALPSVLLSPGDTIKLELIYIGQGTISATVNFAFINIAFSGVASYVLKRETYTASSGLPNFTTAFNLADITPKQCLIRHGDFLKGCLFNQTPGKLLFQSTDKNPDVSFTKGGVTITESANISIASMPSPLFYGFLVEFKTKVPLNFVDIQSAAANGHIKLRFNGKDVYIFPIDVRQKPALNEGQTWKGLLSPLTDLSVLQDLEIDGLNYFTMSGFQTFIPHLCPVQFVPIDIVFPTQYHHRTMDQDWFTKQITRWSEQRPFYQPWQTNDIIWLQIQTNGLGPAGVELINCSGAVLQSVSLTEITTSALQSPRRLFQGTINLTGLDEGLYYLVLTVGTGGTITKFISEPMHVKEDWLDTLLIEYTHSRNKQATFFVNPDDPNFAYTPSIRIPGWIDNFMPQAKFAAFEDQPADLELLNGIPYRTYKVNTYVVADWMTDKFSRITLLNSTRYDGTHYTRNQDAKLEVNSAPGNPQRWWSLEIREADNRQGITLNTNGLLDENITVVYNIETKAFGDGSGQGGVVQVTKVQ